METYTALAGFAQTWGLVYFVLMFLAAMAYALWPSKGSSFDAASHIPLRED